LTLSFTFRTKLLFVVGTAALALLIVVAGSSYIGVRQTQDLLDVESRLVPRLKLGPELESEFERLTRRIQDAVAAQDRAALDSALVVKSHIFELLGSSGQALDPRDAAAVRWAVQGYYETAHNVAVRLMGAETGETLVDEVSAMQESQRKAVALIKKTTGLDQDELSRGFAAVRDANRRAGEFRLAIGLAGILLVVSLSLWVSQRMLRGLGHLSSGFSRFATGDFSQEIPITSGDELGNAAREANQMAASLKRLSEQRERDLWLREGEAGLSDELRGEFAASDVAARALQFIARRVSAVAGAFYLNDGTDRLALVSRYAQATSEACTRHPGNEQAFPHFCLGDGLIGRAALERELSVVSDLPNGYLRVQSGLGEAAPRCLVLVPLARAGRAIGVLELALFSDCSADTRQFLASVREMLVITLEAAQARTASRELLERTQRQAERLAAQEEELRQNNHDLQDQQLDLRRVNEELETQRQALSDNNLELEAARNRVQQKAEELERVSSYKSQFLANMSHELRTPLNSMLLLSGLLAENASGNLTAKQVEYGKTIHSAGQDLLALINQVLDLSKIEAGKQDIEIDEVPLAEFADHARRVFSPLAGEKGLELEIEIAPGMPASMATDRLRVERILINLLGNAIKFTEKGRVLLRISRPAPDADLSGSALSPEGTIAFVVSDTGIGIAPEAQARVFAPFEQLEGRTDRRYAGTGLGLAIARESAELLGGDLQLYSVPGRGSVFTCHLPERQLRNASISSLPSPASAPSARSVADDRAALDAGDPHLLVIEDDAVVSEQLVEIIRARKFKVLVASTGKEGLELARRHRPQGILLDVKLPDIDGFEVMDLLHRDDRTRSIPVHFVTGVDSPGRGFALGAVGYLTKPARRGELVAAVRMLTREALTHAQRTLVVEDDSAEGGAIVEVLRNEGLAADHVRTAAAAIASLATNKYDCLIVDLGLPDMDGLELLEALRASPDGYAPRIVVHTGRALTKRETRQLEAYAETVILKDGDSQARLIDELRLFVRHVKDNLPPAGTARRSEAPPADVSLAGFTILLAEDDMRTIYALAALLRGKGADVLVAETGREALDMLAQHPTLHAVLMDIMMPEMDGYQAMKLLRQDARFARLPVIALTAKAMMGERERCLEAGASDYLTKPVDGHRLLSTLESWLRPKAAGLS
jgi:CheY-like chemotaxis protein/HAMP domain-containing protein